MKTCIALLASMLCVATPTLADDDSPSINIDLHSRVSYLNNRIGNEINHANSGYKGEYFLLSVSGQINDKISYAWRQRLNKNIDNNSMFDATDWLYVDYKFAPNWSVAAGKQVVLIGGYEYDRNPIDVNVPSEYWNNIAPFQFGASASYTTNDGNHRFSGQISQSPYNMPMHRDLLSYNLFWAGKCGMLSTLWSVNMVETTPYHYISYISLGNRIDINNGWIDGNAIAVFTAIGMCWSGFLSTHTAMLDSLGYRDLTPKAISAHFCGGLVAAICAHWMYFLFALVA